MSEHGFEKYCSQLEEEAIEKLFEKMSLGGKQEESAVILDEREMAIDKLFEKMSLGAKQEESAVLLDDVDKSQKQQKLAEDLEQLQRRQSVVYESAQKQVTVLETLLKNVDPGWHKMLGKGRLSEPRPPPQAYLFKDIYEQKKQKLVQQQQEQERAQRQFRSRPMPDFSQAHRQLDQKHAVPRVTRPVTPNVLRASRNMLKRRNQKIEELRKQREEDLREQQVHFKSKFRPGPLKPANIQMPLNVKPFPLLTEQRAEQRKIFNAQVQEMQEARRREHSEQRQKSEQEEYRKKRNMTIFHARPNPFKAQLGGKGHKTI